MTKTSKLLILILSTCFVLSAIAIGVGKTEIAYAAEHSHNEEVVGQGASTRGIYTSLSLSLNGGNGKVWATVKNDLTIFPSNVYVIVELYSSVTYQESYTNMDLVASNSTVDLNMGQTIKAESNTEGLQRYWHGRMRYKVDNGSWKEEVTGTLLYSADGTFLGLI